MGGSPPRPRRFLTQTPAARRPWRAAPLGRRAPRRREPDFGCLPLACVSPGGTTWGAGRSPRSRRPLGGRTYLCRRPLGRGRGHQLGQLAPELCARHVLTLALGRQLGSGCGEVTLGGFETVGSKGDLTLGTLEADAKLLGLLARPPQLLDRRTVVSLGNGCPPIGRLRPGLGRCHRGTEPRQLIAEPPLVGFVRGSGPRRSRVSVLELGAVIGQCGVEGVLGRGRLPPCCGRRRAALLESGRQSLESLLPHRHLTCQPVAGPGYLLGRRGRDLLGGQDLGCRLGPDTRRLRRLPGRVDRTQRHLVLAQIIEDAGEAVDSCGERIRRRRVGDVGQSAPAGLGPVGIRAVQALASPTGGLHDGFSAAGQAADGGGHSPRIEIGHVRNNSNRYVRIALPHLRISLGEGHFPQVESQFVTSHPRSDGNEAAAVLVDVENVSPVPVPLRRAADGALVADWGQVPARVYVAGLSGDGQRTMTQCLQAIAAWVSGGTADIDTLPWAGLRFSHTTAIRAALARAVSEGRYAPATANKHLAALRGALKAAWRLGVMETDDYLRAVDLRPVSGSRLPAGRDVEQSELAALIAHCRADESPAGIRDGAVIGLAYLSGTRRAELAALHLADVDTDPAGIRVVGKGGKQRLVPLSPTVRPLLEGWMTLRGDDAGPLFCPIDRAGSLRLGRALSGEAIRQILSRRALAAGLAAITPHDLRRTYAGDLLDAGADLPAVQQLMGHASPSTTSRYDRRGDKARRSAAERLSLELVSVPADVAAGDPRPMP